MADDARRQKLSLDALIEHGLEVAGRPVDRIKVRVPGIGWTTVSIPLTKAPVNGESEDDDDGELTPTQQRVLEILRASEKPLTRQEVANRFDPPRSSTGGKFTQYIRDLMSRGLVVEHERELSDAVGKFKLHRK